MSHSLPKYSGPYSVGAIDVEVPCDGRVVHPAKLKSDGRPAFQLETVLFALYYPATHRPRHAGTSKKHSWLPHPLTVRAEGYARFLHISNWLTNRLFASILWALVGRNHIPADVDAPLRPPTAETVSLPTQPLDPATAHEDKVPIDMSGDALHPDPRYPVIVFSHGFLSSRTDYTQYCGELASRGYVVAAIEHRDGSGASTVVNENAFATGEAKPAPRPVFPISTGDLESNPPLDTAALKQVQLAFRQAEIEETIRVLRMIEAGRGPEVHAMNARHEGVELAGWRERIDTERVVLIGHSLGATGVLRALEHAPSPSLPLAGCIALDPGKESGPLNDKVSVPLMVLHSNSWSKTVSVFMGRPHFDVVYDIAEKALQHTGSAWFMTSLGTTHPSVTDAPLLHPTLLSWTTGATIDVWEGVMQYVRRTAEFMVFVMKGQRRGLLAKGVTHAEYLDAVHRKLPKGRRLEEDFGSKFWQIHVAPTPEITSAPAV